MATDRAALRIAGTRELLLPFGLSVGFVLYQLAGLSGPVVSGVLSPLLLVYLLAPMWARSSLRDFDRDLVRLLARGRRDALLTRYRRAFGMRLFAPRALVSERQALVAAELGEHAVARRGFGRALQEYGPQAPLRVMLGYAHACHALAEDQEAIRMYERLLKGSGDLPGVRRRLAHSLLRLGREHQRALSLLEGSPSMSEDAQTRSELDLLRALAHAKLGQKEQAREFSKRGRDARGELAEQLQRELERALSAIDEGSTRPPS